MSKNTHFSSFWRNGIFKFFQNFSPRCTLYILALLGKSEFSVEPFWRKSAANLTSATLVFQLLDHIPTTPTFSIFKRSDNFFHSSLANSLPKRTSATHSQAKKFLWDINDWKRNGARNARKKICVTFGFHIPWTRLVGLTHCPPVHVGIQSPQNDKFLQKLIGQIFQNQHPPVLPPNPLLRQ